jgi:hypothetical protein
MIKKYVITFSLLLAVYLFCVSSVYANAPFVIGERSAWGYEYVVTKENENFTWKIGYKGNTSTVIENKENELYLFEFRNAVRNLDRSGFTVQLAALYVVLIGVIAFITYKKHKKLWKESWRMFAIFVIIGLYFTITTYLDVDMALNDARVSYEMLTNWQ